MFFDSAEKRSSSILNILYTCSTYFSHKRQHCSSHFDILFDGCHCFYPNCRVKVTYLIAYFSLFLTMLSMDPLEMVKIITDLMSQVISEIPTRRLSFFLLNINERSLVTFLSIKLQVHYIDMQKITAWRFKHQVIPPKWTFMTINRFMQCIPERTFYSMYIG